MSIDEACRATSPKGDKRQMGVFQQPFKRAMKLAGMSEKIVPHMFRHAFAAHILERGGQLQTRQTLLATKII
jgi:site-specific recombinase XerD